MERAERLRQMELALEVLYGRHGGYIEVRLIDPFGDDPPAFCSLANKAGRAEKILSDIERWDGKRNIYVGRSLRTTQEYGSTESVDWVTCLSIDIDPVRAAKDSPASDEEQFSAIEYAKSLHGGVLVSTGNGAQLWYRLSEAVDIRGRRKWWQAACQEWERVMTLGAPPTVKVDPQFDVPRIVKLPGTLALKGTEVEGRVYRWAEVLFCGPFSYDIHVDSVISYAPKAETERVTPAMDNSAPIPPRFWTSLGRDARLREAWFGERKDLKDDSGSGQHMALAIRLRQLGFTKQEAATILPGAPGGKKRFTEGYARVTLDKAYGG